jgi:hypothetical protein
VLACETVTAVPHSIAERPGADASVDASVDVTRPDGGPPDATPSDATPEAEAAAPPPPAAIFVQDAFTTLYAVSDVHAHLDDLGALLVASGLVDAESTFPADVRWTGGDATFVVVGDLIDKGPSSLGVLATCQALQNAATAAGGSVVVLLGNHEAEFFAAPNDAKFQGDDRIDHELAEQVPPITPDAFAAGATPLSAWLRARPVGARIGAWFFAHAGNTGGASIDALDAQFRDAGFADPAYAAADSLLEAEAWYTSVDLVDTNLTALGVRHLAFGHDPGAFDEHGHILLPSDFGTRLVKLDTGLGNDEGHGEMLRVRLDGSEQVVEAIRPNGAVRELARIAP